MADTYEKDLAQKSSLTTSDFIRVVGSDNVSYKQQVSNVKTAMGIWKVFDNTSLLTSQVDALSEGAHQGIIYAYSKQSETGTPVNSNFYLHIYVSNSANYKEIFAYPISATAGECYALIKRGASWDANWVHFPTRAEVDALTTVTTPTGATFSSKLSNTELNVRRCGKHIVGTTVFRADQALAGNGETILTGLPTTNYRLQIIGICVAGSEAYKAKRFAIYQGTLSTYWSGSDFVAGDTWLVNFSYIATA